MKRTSVRRFVLCTLAAILMVTTSLPSSEAQTFPVKRPFTAISAYDDDPYVADAAVERMNSSKFDYLEDGRPILFNDLVWIGEESKIYRENASGVFVPFAWNPWMQTLVNSNAEGDFQYPFEERFPFHKVERGPDGKVVVRDGLQVWSPQELHRGMTTTFEAANSVKEAVEAWSGRHLSWGDNGQLYIGPHGFIEFNAFYSPITRSIFLGVVPYRLPGETEVRMFETASAWELVAHECGHAVDHVLKPNQTWTDEGFDYWSESFGDQLAMWTSLRDPDRVANLLSDTGYDLDQSNALTRLVEAFARLTGRGTGVRDAYHNKKVSDTTTEVHNRSEVLTGAAYKIFLSICEGLKNGRGSEEAVAMAGDIMGTFLTRAGDFTPENRLTLEDVGKAYLKVDKELFHGRYHTTIVDEFTKREIFDGNSVYEWMAHEASIPDLRLPRPLIGRSIERFLESNLEKLGTGSEFGLKLQSVTPDGSPRITKGLQGLKETIVRVQLTLGRGDSATPLANHGILVFRENGTLADYHAPVAPENQVSPLSVSHSQTRAVEMIGAARQLGFDAAGATLSLVRRQDGKMTVESSIIRGEGLNAYAEVFTLENPRGERREIVVPPVPRDKSVLIPESLLR